MLRFLGYILIAFALFSAGALIAAKFILKKSWRETFGWLVEFFS